MTRLATARLTHATALAAYCDAISPVMTRDVDRRDRLASDVDVAAHVVSLLRHEAEDSAESMAALVATGAHLSEDETQRAHAEAYSDLRDLDFGAPLQRRTRAGSGVARSA